MIAAHTLNRFGDEACNLPGGSLNRGFDVWHIRAHTEGSVLNGQRSNWVGPHARRLKETGRPTSTCTTYERKRRSYRHGNNVRARRSRAAPCIDERKIASSLASLPLFVKMRARSEASAP